MDKTLQEIKEAEIESAKKIVTAQKESEAALQRAKEEAVKKEREEEEKLRSASQDNLVVFAKELEKKKAKLQTAAKKDITKLEQQAKKNQTKTVDFIIKKFEDELQC